ncbi:hypothetical protein GQ457_15G018190 [Hibiscus cannabinus]
MEMDQAGLVYCSFGIDCQCFYFFYLGASIICLNWMTKGIVIGLCLSPDNCSACLYTVPSTVELSPHAIRCRKVPFLTRRNSIASS